MRSDTLTIELSGANIDDLREGASPMRRACSLAGNCVFERDVAGLKLTENDGKRHPLAHVCWGHKLIRIFS
jgi:hypothetical protein